MVGTANPKAEYLVQQSEYAPLYDHLCNLETDQWVTGFAEIETILGSKLPSRARTDLDWWWNRVQAHWTPQARAWRTAGWLAFDADLDLQTVSFRRQVPMHVNANPNRKFALFEEWDRRPHDFGTWPAGLEISRHNVTMGHE